MAEVLPFRGLRYNPQKFSDLTSVITPPYDVISPEQQRAYHERNPHNFIRLEFGLDLPGDNAQSSKYARASKTLNDWLGEGILVKEKSPAFYLVEHRVPLQTGYRSYLGLIAAIRLEEFGTGLIRPTEVVMKGPIADRMELLKACHANLSPIMGVFDAGKLDLRLMFKGTNWDKPQATGIDNAGVTFNLWAVTAKDVVEEVSRVFAQKVIYIADGHHRYTTALAYREEQLKKSPGANPNEPYNFIMMTLISSADPGLVIMPTHRLVKNLKPEKLARLKDQLNERFHTQVLKSTSPDVSVSMTKWQEALKEAGTDSIAFGIYGLEAGSCLLLKARNAAELRDMMPKDRPAAWKNLDVSLLHAVILQGMLGIEGVEKEKECLEYSSNGAKLLQEVDAGKGQLAILLNTVPISAVIAIAEADSRMPQKSTYFYPKTPAGLVVNPHF
ncbi:MAG: DUF1015 domain-containing protein [Dehalococcoidia bacterium]|nr:DUF1015 domain-containing protein [Dehalococcoidia bacterium]